MKYFNWVPAVVSVLGGLIILNLLSLSDISIFPQLRDESRLSIWGIIIIDLIIIFLLVLLVFKYFIRKEKPRVKVDERESAISDRSARNGFIATYLTLSILLILGVLPDAKSLLIVIATSFFVWLISYIFYYYRKA